jgi:hypothetical protein
MPRVAYALLLALAVLPFSAGAAGHDVSSIRYAPFDFFASPEASVAYNGKHFLTLWPMSHHIYGSLADPSGGTPSPAFLAVPFATPYALQLTAAGSGYLGIWNQETPSLGTFTAEGALERRVPLDADTFSKPLLAFNGTNVLVVDRTGPTTNAIEGSVYDLGGRLVTRFLLPVFGYESYAVTSTGSDFVAVTAGRSGINEWRLTANGTILSTLQILPPPANALLSQYDVAVTAKGGRIVIAWEQLQLATLSSAVIQPDGSTTRSELPTGGVPPVAGVTILPLDLGFFVAWHARPAAIATPTGVFAVRLDDTGAPLDARPVNLGNGPFTSAASSGKSVELTLSSASHGQTTLIADVDANGISPRTTTQIPITPVRQLYPVVAGNGAGFTTAWVDLSATSQNAVAARVTATGEALDGLGITLGQQTSSPVIAHGSSGELMVWSANGHLLATLLSPLGTALDLPPTVIAQLPPSPSSGSYSVAWSGGRFLVVWIDGAQLLGAFVGPDGIATAPNALGAQLPPLTLPSEIDLAWDGHQFLLVYGEISLSGTCTEGCVRLPDHVRLLRISAGGSALDVVPVAIPGIHLRAHVASSGAEFMIALDSHTDTTAMIVRDEGGILQFGPEITLFHWLNTFGSDVAWTGSLYAVAWQYEYSPTEPGWIGVSRISQSGVPFASLFTSTTGPAEGGPPLSTPSVAANDAGDSAVVISEMAPPYYAARARLYLMSELAPMPAAPRAPRNVVTYGGDNKAVIVWQSDGPQTGFLVERSPDFGKSWLMSTVTPDIRGVTLLGLPNDTLFRVSAIGPGGFSEPVAAAIGKLERRRAERR